MQLLKIQFRYKVIENELSGLLLLWFFTNNGKASVANGRNQMMGVFREFQRISGLSVQYVNS